MLVSPRRGFKRALEIDRTTKGSRTGAVLVSLPAALAGAFLLLAFLKVRSLIGFREIDPQDFKWEVFAGALATGALAGVIGHYLFGLAARPMVSSGEGGTTPRSLRLVASLASVPVALGFVLLLLLDVVIAGRDAYSAIEDDTLVTAWTAGSLVLCAALIGWSAYLFAQGLSVATRAGTRRSIMVGVLGVFCVLVAAPVALLLMIGVVTLVGLLVDLAQAVSK